MDSKPMCLTLIENELRQKDLLIEDKDKTIQRLQLELKLKEEQMDKLIQKNVELSLRIISTQNKNEGMTL